MRVFVAVLVEGQSRHRIHSEAEVVAKDGVVALPRLTRGEGKGNGNDTRDLRALKLMSIKCVCVVCRR